MASVVRSAYRQILRSHAQAQKRYPDPNDFCFALFGPLLNRNDFANGGYGKDFSRVLHHAFARPSVEGAASDTPGERLKAAFAALRQIRELDKYPSPRAIRAKREELLSTGKDAGRSPLVPKSPGEETTAAREGGSGGLGEASPTPSPELPSQKGDLDEWTSEDEVAAPSTLSLFVDVEEGRKVLREVRHGVFAKEETKCPPYSYLVPPEPLYVFSAEGIRPFLTMTDAIVCLAATSKHLRAQQALYEAEEERALGYTPRCTSGSSPADSLASSEGPSDTPAVPCNKEALDALLQGIHTRVVSRTDCVEIELVTKFTATESDTESSGSVPRHLFQCFLIIRNASPSQNPHLWHARLLSVHLTLLMPERNEVVDLLRPLQLQNPIMLAPGETHVSPTSVTMPCTTGVLRGTFQINLYNEHGRVRMMDAAIPPARMSVDV